MTHSGGWQRGAISCTVGAASSRRYQNFKQNISTYCERQRKREMNKLLFTLRPFSILETPDCNLLITTQIFLKLTQLINNRPNLSVVILETTDTQPEDGKNSEEEEGLLSDSNSLTELLHRANGELGNAIRTPLRRPQLDHTSGDVIRHEKAQIPNFVVTNLNYDGDATVCVKVGLQLLPRNSIVFSLGNRAQTTRT